MKDQKDQFSRKVRRVQDSKFISSPCVTNQVGPSRAPGESQSVIPIQAFLPGHRTQGK